MGTYRISKTFASRLAVAPAATGARRGEEPIAAQGEISEKAAAVMRMFGVTADRLAENKTTVDCQIEINEGDVVYITGPSGAGKSVLLKELEKCIPAGEKINLAQIKPPKNKSVIDCLDGDVLDGLRLLSTAGLGDVFCIVNEAGNLSDGQKWRLRLAMALAARKKFIFADEFCCGIDAICAAVVSYNIHKFAKRSGVTFILAGAKEDILADLQPDVIVIKELSGATRVIYKKHKTDKTERIS